MDLKKDVQECLNNARIYVSEGVGQILADNLDESHGVSASPGATALAALALLAAGRGFENAQQQGIQWLRLQYHHGWGKYPGDEADDEITKIVGTVLEGSRGGWKAKLKLLSQMRQFSQIVLSLGDNVVSGLEGPTPEEIVLPKILEEQVLAKLPPYGRPVVVAASLLASNSRSGITEGIRYLLTTQMADGSWAEDIVSTSLAMLALLTISGEYLEQSKKAAQWLVQRQYSSGGWPAFDQLKTWSMGWAVAVFGETSRYAAIPWFKPTLEWLKKSQNADGSFGSTPPFTHPDLDDTAVALIGLQRTSKEENELGIQLLKNLQNEDGSWGTFPSFQGLPPNINSEFPVYISSVDVSIHVLEALWRQRHLHDGKVWRGLNWVLSQQDRYGAFPASWFEGPVYSTAQVIELLGKGTFSWERSWERWNFSRRIFLTRKKGQEFLLNAQDKDGGWGSVVETSLALAGLWRYLRIVPRESFEQGIKYLLKSQVGNGSFKPSYKGIYAKSWNYEEPLTTALTAIRALQRYQCLYNRAYY